TNTAGATIAGTTAPQGIAIAPDQAPVAKLTAKIGAAGGATAFDASTSTVAFGTIASYAWDFGDGTAAQTTTTPTASHTYA
ncbi:PKD domain-containing protein, partial [Salmonella sp. SAL4358]|uniref:PKD domain-containing protein n=1 Tax=Salmonella sp. SAL4358 TaxID=3159879 RepID=UPI00397951F8